MLKLKHVDVLVEVLVDVLLDRDEEVLVEYVRPRRLPLIGACSLSLPFLYDIACTTQLSPQHIFC